MGIKVFKYSLPISSHLKLFIQKPVIQEDSAQFQFTVNFSLSQWFYLPVKGPSKVNGF